MKYIKSNDNEKKLNIFLIISAVVCFLAASSVLPFTAVKGSGAPCDILLCFVCAVPFFAGAKKAGIFALALGFAADLFIGMPTEFSPVIFLACIFIVPAVARLFSRAGTLVIAICTLPCIVMKDIFGMIVSLFTAEGADLSGVLSDYRPFTILVDFACAICLAFILRFISKRLHLQADSL
jgi:hypothetical protein